MGSGLVQRCARRSGFVGSTGCSPAASSTALAGASAAHLLPRSLSRMRLPRNSWRNPLPLRLCCSRGLQISDGGSSASHLARNQKGRHKTCRFVFPGCLRRWISDGCPRGLLVFSKLWCGGRELGLPLLRCALAERCLSSGGGLVGTPHRAREHHGLYSPAFQLVPGGCCIRTFAE